jgi:ubiquinone/menaquinone biosynthesis C-methylase UbiE
LVLDVGCGTGRALPALRQAVGARGRVIAVDLTPEMLRQARDPASAAGATLILADARHLPFPDGTTDAVFAAGLIMHLPDTDAGLRQLARITGRAACSSCSTPRAGPRSPPATAAHSPGEPLNPAPCGGQPGTPDGS